MNQNGASIWVYPWDLQDEGVTKVLDRLQQHGFSEIKVAAFYHSGRFFLPHNPQRKMHFPEPGALYFQPDEAWYGNISIKPPVSRFASASFWHDLREETKKRGMSLTCWILACHNSQIGFEHPHTSTVNAFGDVSAVALCPSNPDVQELILAVVEDISKNYAFDGILIESLEYMPFRHDYHHEVIGIPLTPAIDFLMRLSFSDSMVKGAMENGIDAERVRDFAIRTCERHFMNPEQPVNLSWEDIHQAIDGELSRFLAMEQAYLTGMIKNIHKSVRQYSQAKISVCDFGPLFRMEADGTRWENGVDLAEWAPYIDEINPTLYFADEHVFLEKVRKYKEILQSFDHRHIDVVPALRAVLPQVATRDDLKKQVRLAAEMSGRFAFYNYGFMSYRTLDWIEEVLQEFG